ncbi:MAG TPA: hypothetical protein VE291_01045 [Terracidiphilus sp.]|jgi:hypothetical protein|nr:hypothetical protein [Terracidiphilus sp.]
MSDEIRPGRAKVTTLVQGSATCLVILDWGIWATWGRFPSSLLISGIVFSPALILCAISTVGVWKGKLFGWITGLLGDSLFFLILLVTSGPLCVLPAAALIFLLLRETRELYIQDYYE